MWFINYFRRLVGSTIKWFTEVDKKVSMELQVNTPAGVKTMTAVEVMGLHLRCDSETGQQLVPIAAAVDKDHWVDIYISLGGNAPKWPDGTPYDFFPKTGL